MEQFTELFQFAFEGAPFKLYACLNTLAFAAHRMAGVSTKASWIGVASLGAVAGGWGAYIEAMSIVGQVNTILWNAGFTGAIIGAGAATIVGASLALAVDKSGIFPQSAEKKLAEAYRDPLNPATPATLADVDVPKVRL